MKLNQNKPSTPPQTSDYQSMNEEFIEKGTEFRIQMTPDYVAYCMQLMRPNPPTAEAVKRAQFVDKTYQWTRN